MPDPTNPLATATTLAIGTTGTHTLNASTLNDYYRFTLSGRSSLNLSLTGLTANVDLQLLGSGGAVLQQSTNTGTTAENVNATDLSAGVYYIRVLAASGATSAPYTLALQAQTNATTALLWRNYSTGQNVIWQMQDTTLVSSGYLQPLTDLHWSLEGAADFTGDGQADWVWHHNATGQNMLWQMQGTTMVSTLALPSVTDLNWRIAGMSDFNADGQTDLVWRNAVTGENAVWLMQGTTFASVAFFRSVTDFNWHIVGVSDFNADGQTDLVWRNYATGENSVWLMQGTTFASVAFFTPVTDLNWHIEGVGDFNGDNQPDLVWRNYATGQDVLWHMQGTQLAGAGMFFTPVNDVNWRIAAPLVRYGYPGLVAIAGKTPETAFDLGTLNGQATYHSTISSGGGSDYYRLHLTAPNPAVYLRTSTGNLELLSSSGSVLQRAVTAGAPVHIQRALDSGSYYLRVYGTTSYVLGVFDTTAPPTITTGLVHDTALSGTNTDHRTADPTIAVQVGTEPWLGRLTAGLHATAPVNFLDLTALAGLGNSLTLTPTQLQAINGGLALTDGSYVLQLRATGVYDVTAATTALAFTLDTTTVAPSGLRLAAGTGNTTNVTTPTVTGQAEVGALVKVYDAGNVLLGQGIADSSGNWQATLSLLTEGTSNVTAIVTDVAGNVSLASAPLSLVVDTTLPTLNVTTALTTPLLSSTRLTGTVNGTGSAIVALSYHFDDRPAIALAFDPVTGTFDQALDLTGVTSGTHTLTLTTTDAAGNDKTLQTTVTVGLGTAPVITGALAQDTAPDGLTNDDGVTSNPTISGQVTNAPTVLRAGFGTGANVNYGDITAQVQADGSFTLHRTQLEALSGGTLLDAPYTLSLQAVDAAGNVTTPLAITFDLDTQAPTAPSNLSLAPAGLYAVAITGNAEAGAQVQLFAGTTLVGEAVANATGSWRVTTSQLRNGTHSLTATASDAAGNTSPATTATTFTVETLVPSTPQGLRLTALTDSGQSQTDNITNDATPTIVGTAEAGATVRLFREQQLLGETTADVTTGAWSLALTTALPEGEQNLSVVAHNAIGDSQTATLLTTIDTVAPTTTPLQVMATGSTTATALAHGVTLTTGTRLLGQVNGTTSAIASLQYQLGTSPAVTVPVVGNGLFNYRLDLTGSSSGTQALTVTLTDVAGNTTTLAPFTVNVATTSSGGGGEAPVLVAQLLQDTGSDVSDGWTYVPGIAGVASAPQPITALLATFDSAATAVFQDLTSLLQPDGTFTLDEDTLATLAGGALEDGAYTLRLQVQAGSQIEEQGVRFKLDRTAPVTTLPDLIDGIAWERGTQLQGTVVEASAGVHVAYTLETVNGVAVGSAHTLTVTDQAFDQVLDAATLTEETPYNLVLTSTDRAGNAQRSRFQFFIPGERRVTDDDPWTPPRNPSDPDTDPSTDPPLDPKLPLPPGQIDAGNVTTWGYVGAGGNWGYYGGSGTGGNGGSGWTPGYTGNLTPETKDGHKAPTGSGYEYEYVEGLGKIVTEAVTLISTSPATIHQKGALANRQQLLLALGNRLSTLIHVDDDFTNDQALMERLRPALEGLFVDAYDPTGVKAGVFENFVPWEGAWVAQGLVQDALSPTRPLSVREQVFQATLLTVVTEATLGVTNVAQQQALATAVMALAKTYAWLNPHPEGTVPVADKDFGFLDALWRLQLPDANGQFKGSGVIAQTLEDSVVALKRLLAGVQDPVRAIQFLNNLVQAASNVTSLKGDVKDATFLRELVEFGVEFVKTNPTVNATSTDAAVQGFLDRLWRGDTQQVKQAQGGLNAFFAGMETEAARIKGLAFAENLIDAATLLQDPELQTQKHDPVFLDALVELGGAYAALHPNTQQSLDEALTPLHSVLAQLYPDGEVMEASAVGYLESYLQQPGGSSESIELSTLFLRSFRNDSRYVNQWGDLNWINSFLSITRPYDKSTLISNDDGFIPVSSMERSLNADEIKYLRDTFGNSIDYNRVIITRGNFASTGSSKTLGNTIHLEDTSRGKPVFQKDGKSLTPEGLILVSHEMTHVWQWQNGGFAYAPESLIDQVYAYLSGGDLSNINNRNNAYLWQNAYKQGLDWKNWGPEQQAQAMQEYNEAIQAVYRGEKGRKLAEANSTIRTLTPYVMKVRQKQGAPTAEEFYRSLSPGNMPSVP